jgi:hypothetical protein
LTNETKDSCQELKQDEPTFMINLKVDNPNRYDMDERTGVLVMELDDCNSCGHRTVHYLDGTSDEQCMHPNLSSAFFFLIGPVQLMDYISLNLFLKHEQYVHQNHVLIG